MSEASPTGSASSTDSARSHSLKVIIAFALVYVFWGSTYLAIGVTSAEGIPPFVMCATRFLIAGPLMLGVCALFGRTVTVSATDAARLATVGGLLLVAGNGGLAWAEQYFPTGYAALIIAVTPIWFLVLETFVFRGDRLSRRGTIGLAMGIVGIALLMWPKVAHRETLGIMQMVGSISLLFSSFSWAVGSVLSRRWQMKVDPFVATSWEMIFAGLGHLILALITGQYHHAVFNQRGITVVMYLIVFGSWIGYTAYIWLLKHVPTPKVATYAYVNPIVAVFLGWLILHESFDRYMQAGSIVIVAAVALVTTAKVHPSDLQELAAEGPPELESEV
jgi:drug/metabolite transporter (DMT)-like permease